MQTQGGVAGLFIETVLKIGKTFWDNLKFLRKMQKFS